VIQLGTIAPIGFEDFASPNWLACMRQLGCTVVQAYRNPQAGVTADQMRDYIAAGQMPCDSLHGLYGDHLDPSCLDEQSRARAVETFREEGRLVKRLGGDIVVIHGAGMAGDRALDAPQRKQRLDQLARSIEQLGHFGREIQVRYAFENLPAYHALCSSVGELTRLLIDVGAPNTGLCFDTGHAHMVMGAPEGLDQTRGQTIYVHFCDNSGQADEHLMPGQGTLDLPRLARKLHEIDYAGTVMLEVFHPVETLNRLIDTGYGEKLAEFLAIANGG
jgi:sugar phosphate isomerase/epimerase